MTNTKQVLLHVTYQDDKKKYWKDSYIKNKIFNIIDNDIHKTVAEALKEHDYTEVSYKGKPQSNVYVDTKDGETKAIGYIYRVKTDIQDDYTYKTKEVFFDAWVTIYSISDYEIKELI